MYAMVLKQKEREKDTKIPKIKFSTGKVTRASSDKALHVQSGRIYLKTITSNPFHKLETI